MSEIEVKVLEVDKSGNQLGRWESPAAYPIGLAWLGDIDGNGTGELAVGASHADDGATDQGAVWVLSLSAAGARAPGTATSPARSTTD